MGFGFRMLGGLFDEHIFDYGGKSYGKDLERTLRKCKISS